MQIIVTDDGSRTLFCSDAGESFHSESGAACEAQHVFLANSGAQQRLSAGLDTEILEIGFGAGLNFFLTADLALRSRTALRYVAIERQLIDPQTLLELEYDALLENRNIVSQVASFIGAIRKDRTSSSFLELDPCVSLELRVGDARHVSLQSPRPYHAVYHDAFSPRANPELWTGEFMAALYERIEPGATVVSYCVKTEIQKRMIQVGFDVTTPRGPPGGKRQVLVARKI